MKKVDDLIIEKAVNLSLIEIALGSVVHSLKVPFGGQILSLNQGLFLTRVSHAVENRFRAAKVVVELSVIVSIMKSLSPAGRKLGPMMSISTQGGLYSLGILLGGTSLFGQILGMVLLSIWSFIQPLITYFLIYGPDLIEAFNYFIKKMNKYVEITSENLIFMVSALIVGKAIVAALIPVLLRYLPSSMIEKYDLFLARVKPEKIKREVSASATKGAFKDMTRPFFLFSMVLMFLFFYLTGDDGALIFWKLLRTVAIAFIIFYLSRSQKFYNLMLKLSGKNKHLGRVFELAQRAYLRIVEN